MSDAAAPVQDPPEIDGADTEESSEPTVMLPGQMTFGWGDEPVTDKSSRKKNRKDKSKKSKRKAEKKAEKASKKSDPAKDSNARPAAKVKRRKPKKAKPKKEAKEAVAPVAEAASVAAETDEVIEAFSADAATLETPAAETDATVTSAAPKKKAPAAKKKKRAAAKVKKSVPKRRVKASARTAAKKKVRTSEPKMEAKPESSEMNRVETKDDAVSYADSVESLPLKWGAKLPSVGFGFWKVENDVTADVCYDAIKVGYRHLDCACDYGNEVEVGQGIRRAIADGIVDREDLWVTSKLWNTYHAPEHVRMACEKSLEDLQLDYLDLYLIHFPIAQRFVPFEKRYPPGWFFDPDVANPVVEEARVSIQETWRALEELTKEGLVRNIGICNFGTSQIRDLLTYAHIRPAVLQVETHPRLTQQKLLRYCQQEKIAYTAFSPLGAQSYYSLDMADPSESLLEHRVVKAIAQDVERTAAQVLLRWGVQRGTTVIPKTSSKERMVENIRVFDFELTADQMQQLDGLDEGRRFNDPGHFGEAAFNTYLPIYE